MAALQQPFWMSKLLISALLPKPASDNQLKATTTQKQSDYNFKRVGNV